MAVYTKIGLDEINLIEKNFSIGKILNYSGITVSYTHLRAHET